MTWLIAVDESGDLGSDSRFFSMAAIITKRVRHLDPVFKSIPLKKDEPKFHNSNEFEIKKVLTALAETDVAIVSITVDKHDYDSVYYDLRGNKLYKRVLYDLLELSLSSISGHDVIIFLDRSRFVSLEELQSMANDLSITHDCTLKKCEKHTSNQNKCIQIADYVVGSVNRYYENDDDRFAAILSKKISLARKN